MNKNEEQLKSFTEYCNENLNERFWQALRNWSENSFILTARSYNFKENEWIGIKDTFYDN